MNAPPTDEPPGAPMGGTESAGAVDVPALRRKVRRSDGRCNECEECSRSL